MRSRYLTEDQNEKRRQQNWLNRCDRRHISEAYPNVNKIVIEYEIEHRSVFGEVNEIHTSAYTPDSESTFIIECLNRECTSGIFDLKDDIFSMVREKSSDYEGEQRCTGSEAPDHMYQSCSGKVKYKIHIDYK